MLEHISLAMSVRKVPSQRRTGGMWGQINQLPIPQQSEVAVIQTVWLSLVYGIVPRAFFVFLLTHCLKGRHKCRNVCICVLQRLHITVCLWGFVCATATKVYSWLYVGVFVFSALPALYSLPSLLYWDRTTVYVTLTSQKLHSSNQTATFCMLDDDKSCFATNRK